MGGRAFFTVLLVLETVEVKSIIFSNVPVFGTFC